MRLPTLFLSHGAPDMALSDLPVTRCLRQLGEEFDGVKTILVASAHWPSHAPRVSAAARPETLHDHFWGSDPELYRLRYPASGNPLVAERALQLLQSAGLNASLDPARGLDHGVWVPLMHLRPAGDIPVVSLSIQPYLDAGHHFAVGCALAPLRDEGVLIIASGAITHDLAGIRGFKHENPVESYARQYADWVKDNVETNSLHKLMNFLQEAPHARRNHPTPEHFLPLFIALGAASRESWRRIHNSWTHGVLAMDIYRCG